MATSAPVRTLPPPKSAPPVSKETQDSLLRYVNETIRVLGSSYNLRDVMQETDRHYQREMDFTQKQQRAQAANRAGDATKMQNITVPVVMPQVEAACGELAQIFLASYPLFPVVAKPQMIDVAIQMETIIGEQGIRFGWAPELMQALRDGLKHNLMAVEVEWCNKKIWSVTNDATQSVRYGVPIETYYQGNTIKRRDPYNLILDVRVPPFEVHTRGEYAGYTELISRIDLKRRLQELDPTLTMNAREAFESGYGAVSTSTLSDAFFVPQVNSRALIAPQSPIQGQSINWHAWAGLEGDQIAYSDLYEYTVLYARILPKEHRITGSGGNTPTIYKLIVINRKVLVYVERKSNAHDFLPIIVAQCLEDGLGWQTKSFGTNAVPFQSLASALYNSGIESQRRKVYDRIFYDPSRIAKADIDNVQSSVARIPVKGEAYGKPVGEAVYIAPYREENVNQIFNVAQMVLEHADIANGQNRVTRGQFQKGNKTRHEFQEVMDQSNLRPQMIALVLEYRFFQPIKEIVKLNTMQFQQAGQVYNRNTKTNVQIDPAKLRTASIEFKMADGLIPVDQYVNTELFQTILQIVGQAPAMFVGQWDIVGMIMYWLKLEGATWIDDFKLQPPTQPTQGPQGAQVPPQPGTTANPG